MLLEDLKSETRSQHQRLEEQNPLPLTREDYIAQLTALYGFVAAWEAELRGVLPDTDPIRAGRTKAGWIEEDLACFGWDAEQIARIPLTHSLPSMASRLHILGAAYVLEGSTLGGQMISRHVESTLGLTDGRGYRYHRSYGREVGTQWQAFRGELLRASSPGNDPVIVGAARDTFTLLHDWFNLQRTLVA